MTGSVLLVRHAEPVVDSAVPPADWPLSPEGIAAARCLGRTLARDLAGRVVAASRERKAVETAAAMVGSVDGVLVDGGFGEVPRPWVETGHREAVLGYLAGENSPGWETPEEAVGRFRRGLDALASGDLAVVTHGTVMTLFVASVVDRFDAPSFWSELAMPDAWVLDLTARTVSRPEGWSR